MKNLLSCISPLVFAVVGLWSPGAMALGPQIVQSNGSILGAALTNAPGREMIARITADGKIDTAFGNKGFIDTNDQPEFWWGGVTVTVQSTGKVVAFGETYDNHDGIKQRNYIARYDEQGQPDLSFGEQATPGRYSAGDLGLAFSGIINSDDSFYVYDLSKKLLFRRTADGLLDATFAGGVGVDFGAKALGAQPDKSVIIFTAEHHFARLTPAGVLDTAFTDTERFRDGPVVALTQADGKIVVLGDDNLTRLNADGSRDETFGVHAAAPHGLTNANSATLDSEGKILVLGLNAGGSVTVARFDASGALDISFQTQGLFLNCCGVVDELIEQYNVSVQPFDQKVIVEVLGSRQGFGFARLNTDGSLDTTFGDAGKIFVHD